MVNVIFTLVSMLFRMGSNAITYSFSFMSYGFMVIVRFLWYVASSTSCLLIYLLFIQCYLLWVNLQYNNFLLCPLGSPPITYAVYPAFCGISYCLYAISYRRLYGHTSNMIRFLAHFPWGLWHFLLLILYHNILFNVMSSGSYVSYLLWRVYYFLCLPLSMPCLMACILSEHISNCFYAIS